MKSLYLAVLSLACLLAIAPTWADDRPESATYSKAQIMAKIERFFGKGAKGLAEVVEKAFRDNGEPSAYIAGNEFSAALGVGIRYGKGALQTKEGYQRTIYWQGPSIGIDAGGNVSKVFMLIYNLPVVEAIFQRYPGVEGSLFFVGGVGMNYLQSGRTIIAPIRLGAGWRQGLNVGYLDFTRELNINPF